MDLIDTEAVMTTAKAIAPMSKASSTKSIQKRSTKPTIEEPSLLTVKAMKGVGGSKNTEFNVTMFYRTLKTGVVCHEEGADPEEEARIGCIATGHALAAFKPTDEIEGMFAAQAVMLHNLSMEAGRRAMISEQAFRYCEQAEEGRREQRPGFRGTWSTLWLATGVRVPRSSGSRG